ncbi:basic helix-loop-helix (bHLH) DNA-binding superfamily protein [Wolffia australiana]
MAEIFLSAAEDGGDRAALKTPKLEPGGGRADPSPISRPGLVCWSPGIGYVRAVPPSIPPNLRSRVRRRGISDRIRQLAKLLPSDRKMNTSAMLEEARIYVKFLEAQVTVLQCMPVESQFLCPPPSSYSAGGFRGLEKLTRQQLLHVLVRSPLVQDKLCGRGLCVFSAEQVFLMRQAAERRSILLQQLQKRRLDHQLFIDSASSSTISD